MHLLSGYNYSIEVILAIQEWIFKAKSEGIFIIIKFCSFNMLKSIEFNIII